MPSYTLKSIWATKGLLHEGLWWRIGTGVNVDINNDPWLPGRVNYKLHSYIIDPNLSTVVDLIDDSIKT